VTTAELHRLLELLMHFDALLANDEPSHLSCMILTMQVRRRLEISSGA
jgi:hypothetical protein